MLVAMRPPVNFVGSRQAEEPTSPARRTTRQALKRLPR